MGVKHENLVLLTGNPKYVLKKKKKKQDVSSATLLSELIKKLWSYAFVGNMVT